MVSEPGCSMRTVTPTSVGQLALLRHGHFLLNAKALASLAKDHPQTFKAALGPWVDQRPT